MAAQPQTLTPEQECAFELWYGSESEELYWPVDPGTKPAARAAFAEGIRVADNSDSIRYAAQYTRRFGLGGARTAERNLRESRGAKGTI